MTKDKSGTYDPHEMIKCDPNKMTGRADGGKEYPKLKKIAELAIADCEESYDEADETLEEEVEEAKS